MAPLLFSFCDACADVNVQCIVYTYIDFTVFVSVEVILDFPLPSAGLEYILRAINYKGWYLKKKGKNTKDSFMFSSILSFNAKLD